MPPFIDLYDRPDEVGQLIVAIQRAIVEHFTEGDWTEFAYQTGTHDYVLRHDRLLRSLSWGDEDYGPCVFKALSHFADNKISALEALLLHPKLRQDLERSVPSILERIGLLTSHVAPVAVAHLSAPEVVARALLDSETLLQTSGPISAVDRLHTALHGYFGHVCRASGLTSAEGASITSLFKSLRTTHPAFTSTGAQDNEVTKVLNGFATVVDALNTLRNNASVAHPNVELLGEAEAHLMVNACRTLFHYVRAKVGPC